MLSYIPEPLARSTADSFKIKIKKTLSFARGCPAIESLPYINKIVDNQMRFLSNWSAKENCSERVCAVMGVCVKIFHHPLLLNCHTPHVTSMYKYLYTFKCPYTIF